MSIQTYRYIHPTCNGINGGRINIPIVTSIIGITKIIVFKHHAITVKQQDMINRHHPIMAPIIRITITIHKIIQTNKIIMHRNTNTITIGTASPINK